MQGEGWTKVISKRHVFIWDVFPYGGRNRGTDLDKVTSFFVSEFPDYYNAKGLFELFGCQGKVVEVAISPKRTRLGKRYAFARFLDVVDGRLLAIRLDNILIEGKKLHVNLPRFNRGKDVGARRAGSSISKGTEKLSFSKVGVSRGNFCGGVRGTGGSYAEVVGKKGQASPSFIEEAIRLNFQSDQELRNRFEKAFVGYVCIPGSAYNLQTYLEMKGIFSIKVTPIGGNCCLLEDIEEGFIEELIKEGWWKAWFNSVEKWEAGKVDGSRDVWLRIFGVPLHVWGSDFFVALGNSWGRFICTDDNTAKGEVFDIARILINNPIFTSIPESVSVCIDGSVYKLCIREDLQGLYRSVGGKQRVATLEETSSENESDGFVLSDTCNSLESVDDVASFTDNKDTVISVPKEKSGAVQHVVHSEERYRSGVKDNSVADPKFSTALSAESVCRLSLGVDNSVLNLVSEGKVDLECGGSSRSISRGSKDVYYSSMKLFPKSSKGVEFSVSKAVTWPIFAGSNCDGGPRDGIRNNFSGPVVTESKEVQGLGEFSACRSDTEEFDCNVRMHPKLGMVASASNTMTRQSRRRKLEKLNFKKPRSLPEFCCQEHKADSIESFDADLCHKISNSLGSGPVEAKYPVSGAKGNDMVIGTKLHSDENCHLCSDSIEAVSDDHSVGIKDCDSIEAVSGAPGIEFLKLNSEPQPAFHGDNGRDCLQVNFVIAVGDRFEGKKLKKAELNYGVTSSGKERQIVKVKNAKMSKMKSAHICNVERGVNFSGSHSTRYGEQSEDSDIRRNNDRQWDFLKRDVGNRLWEAMLALGVVDFVGRKSLNQCSGSGSEGRKEKKIILQ